MSNFYISYAGSVMPVEEAVYTDTTQKTRTIHSQIDSVLSGTTERAHGTAASLIRKVDNYTVADTPVTLSTILGGSVSVTFLSVRINSKLSTLDPEIAISLDGTNYPIRLIGINDFCIIPIGDSQATNYIPSDNIKFQAAGAAYSAGIDILIGE